MTLPQSKVRFFFETQVKLADRTGLKSFIEQIFKKEKKKFDSLVYVFTTDKKLWTLNRKYLKHDYYTDILTFNLSDQSQVQGEVYISLDRVKENASDLKLPFQSEILRVMIHGALHLCGFSDKTRAEKKTMREKEEFYMRKFHQLHKKYVSG